MSNYVVVSYRTRAGALRERHVEPADLATVMHGLYQARIPATAHRGPGDEWSDIVGEVTQHLDTGKLTWWAELPARDLTGSAA